MSGMCLVTGAGGGIGRAIAMRLAKDGYRVLGAGRNLDAVEKVIRELPGDGHRAIALDVSDEAAVIAAFADAEKRGEPIDQVVAAAGILLFTPDGNTPAIVDIELADWNLTQAINSTGTFLLLREYLRGAARRKIEQGRFVGISSVAAQLGGYRSNAAYIASKNAVLGLMKAGAREGAALGITVNTVAPGITDTPMLRQSLSPEKDSLVAANVPLGRIGTPEDMVGAVAFLIGPDASYITGSVIDVNGGYRMQ
ncbi:MAG: short-chain dehydrogenase [Hyphomicrobiales bacterium]|mgnify:CR=1 FL=1|nr:MAG: short-chain dehydrogenase [Hyphomicrobiales bacterium]